MTAHYLHAEKLRERRGRPDVRPATAEGADLRPPAGPAAVLVGVMYSVQRGERGPSPGGPITRWHSHVVCSVGNKRGRKPQEDGTMPAGLEGAPGQRDDARLVHARPPQRVRHRSTGAGALPRRPPVRRVLPQPGGAPRDVRPRLPWPRARVRRRPQPCCPVGRRRRGDRRRGDRALPHRVRGRDASALRDAPRARRLGSVSAHRRAQRALRALVSARAGGRRRWGLDLRRGWEVYPSLVADGDDPHEYVLEGTRAVLVEFPGWWLDVDGAVGLVADGGARSSVRGSCRSSPIPSVVAPWPRIPVRCDPWQRPGGRSASTAPR